MRIGILGASSQVGASVAVYLNKEPGIEVVCFNRSDYANIFFEVMAIPVRKIDIKNPDELGEGFADLDFLVDCTYPAGQLSALKGMLRDHLKAVIAALPVKVPYMHMSSIMAYGMPGESTHISHFVFPRSSYAYLKRYAERMAVRLGKASQRKVYNIRLGQVHGLLQSVSHGMVQNIMAQGTIEVKGRPEEPTNTIFVNAVAEGILRCARAEVPAGTYTLVSSPQWTLAQLYSYYVEGLAQPPEILFHPEGPSAGSSWKQSVIRILKSSRSIWETYFLMHFPLLSAKIKGKYRLTEMLARVNRTKKPEKVDHHLLGVPPFQVLHTSCSSFERVRQDEAVFEKTYLERLSKHTR